MLLGVENNNIMYTDLIKDKELPSLNIPQTIVPSPTENDYAKGFVERFFTQKVNDTNGFVYEIDQKTYIQLLKNPYWISESIYWRITGPLDMIYNDNGMVIDKGIFNANRASIQLGTEKIKNLGLYLPNILQFYK
jgi:hypothetical protein